MIPLLRKSKMSKLPFKLFSITAFVPVILISELQQDTAEITTKQLNQKGMLAVNWLRPGSTKIVIPISTTQTPQKL